MKGIDLFCGCGGLTRGFENAGVTIVEAYDCWADAIECYQQNFSHPGVVADISDTDNMAGRIAHLSPDIIIGGPPCQDFSQAGKRQEGERANLTESFARIVELVRPKWFVMENVDRAQKSIIYRKTREIFTKSGYGLTEELVNASAFGIPQNRRRFFCIGLLGASDGFLSDDIFLQKNDNMITVREYFRNIGHEIDAEHYYRHPRNYARRAVFSIDEPAPTIRGVNRPVPGGYAGHEGDTHGAQKVRPLTSRERALIQTFPPDFILPGTKTTVEQMIGNAVPVKLAEVIAKTISVYEKMSAVDKKRGRKVAQNYIYSIPRDSFMRWTIIAKNMTDKTAKDTWSRLSQTSKYIRLDDSDDAEELFLQFKRTTKNKFAGATSSHIKNAIRLYCEFRRRLLSTKKLSLFET